MNQHDANMRAYYKERAPIYDRVYSYPERQDDLRYLEKYISEQLKDLDVLEIAAGTGYWSQFISHTANTILATDATPEALEQINNRNLSQPVQTQIADAYDLKELPSDFTGSFAGLWLSHVPKQRLDDFLTQLHAHLKVGSRVVFIDNSMAQCERLPLSFTDEAGVDLAGNRGCALRPM